jgi:predicted NAD/FAD-dependent oxidoreductase
MSASIDDRVDAIVIGAGISGLAAASELAKAGCRSIVLEKSRGIGGRMATRRVGAAVCDHGAQFFTVRTRAFGATVAEAQAAGAVRPWCDGFSRAANAAAAVEPAGDGHARWCGTRGMTDLPKRLAAGLPEDRVEIRTGVRAAAVGIVAGGVVVSLEAKEGEAPRVLGSRGLVLSCPVPQSLDLFAAGDAVGALDGAAVESLRGIDYDPCFALMLVLDRPSQLPPPGGLQFTSGPITWIGDNLQKGISTVPALTIHASGDFSRERFDVDPANVTAELEALAAPWIGAATVVDRSLQRWKFAQPRAIVPAPFVSPSAAPPIACCGDAFKGPRVEGAACSGQATGRWMGRLLADGR